MLDLGFLLLLLACSAGVGLRVLERLAPRPERAADALALAVPLGLGGVALAQFGLGELGALNAPMIAAVLAVGGVIGAGPLRESLGRLWRESAITLRCPDLMGLAFDLALGATLLGTLLTALAPVTDGDALCYHLQVPKVFLEAGSLTFEPDLHETVYPLLTELLYAAALALRGPVACRLVEWALGCALGAGVTALARPVLGDRARRAGTIALLVPAVSNGMSAPLNDVALAAFGNAALLAWMRWRERPSLGSAALAGGVAGLALGVKYPALVWVGLLGGCAIGHTLHRKWILASRSWIADSGGLLAFSACSVLIGGGWYARACWFTGNPVFPFFRHVFGGAGLDDVLDPIKRPMAVNAWNLLTALGPLTLEPDRFDSFSHQLGPAFLLFLPGLLLFRPPQRVVGLAAIGYAFVAACLTRRQSMRFLLIAVGPWSVGVAWLAAHWGRRRGLAAVLVLMLAFESSLALGRARHGLDVVLGRETASAYLERREPTFRVGRWIGENLPDDARIIGQDHRGFYLPRPYAMELAHRRRTGLGTRGESAGAIVGQLRREGFTHLLLCPPVPESAVEFDPTLSRRLAPWLRNQAPLYRREIADADRVVRCYEIFELPAEQLAGQGGTRR